jgi:hypothetical protein
MHTSDLLQPWSRFRCELAGFQLTAARDLRQFSEGEDSVRRSDRNMGRLGTYETIDNGYASTIV